jgi:hypothetical protein
MFPTLKSAGFERYCPFKAIQLLGYEEEWNDLRTAFSALPNDNYCSIDIIRQRRYGYAYLNNYINDLYWPPESYREFTAYFQGDYNGEHSNSTRLFASLTPEIRRNPILKLLIDNDFSRTFWSNVNQRQFKVGVHMVRLMVTQGSPVAEASPPTLHRDGEAFTFVHLINRQGVLGGENTVACVDVVGLKAEEVAPELQFARFVLEQELDSFAICDTMVSHALDSIILEPGAEMGIRDVLLIDFTPMIPTLGTQ